MLKALEIVGFKSFAERTRFEFPEGITIVVGPNGSGKSNIVDAIKWALGEQSAKSLRGKEMADVIFNGSGERRALNSSEITLTLDNSKGLLPIDSPEVHITRRVYRSGEGEYLINRQPSRLRDIRDILAGTGLSTQAYSIIEQGKIDQLLQASPLERRAVFEEAAGISRFKGRKLEALRRLERIDQNLLRLSDIVEEVESRLRVVRSQAGKARRYREYTQRLQELRTHAARVDWVALAEQLAAAEEKLSRLRDEHAAASTERETLETQAVELDAEADEATELVRKVDTQIAENREQITATESRIEHERARSADLEADIARFRRNLAALNQRTGSLESQREVTAAEVAQARTVYQRLAQNVSQNEREQTELLQQLDAQREFYQQQRAAHWRAFNDSLAQGKEIARLEARVESLRAAQAQSEKQRSQAQDEKQSLETALSETEARLAAAKESLAKADKRRNQAERERDAASTELTYCRDELGRLKERRSAVAERASVLAELEERAEGIGPGVQTLLQQWREGKLAFGEDVVGMLADLLEVNLEAATLVDVALDNLTQAVVLRRGESAVASVVRGDGRLQGRITFLSLDAVTSADSHKADLRGEDGVLGRAEDFLEASSEIRPLVHSLLAHTWFVENLSQAARLRLRHPHVQLVTLNGELLGPHGIFAAGPKNAATGIISRRSMLRALGEELETLDRRVAAMGETLTGHQRALQAAEAEFSEAQSQCRDFHSNVADAQRTAEQQRQRLEQLLVEIESISRQHADNEQELQQASGELENARQNKEKTDAECEALKAHLDRIGEEISRLEETHQQRSGTTTENKVELAKSEERLRNLEARLQQYEQAQQERNRELREVEQALAEATAKLQQCQQAILAGESEVAELYLVKERLNARSRDILQHRQTLGEKRREIADKLQSLRRRLQRMDETIHAEELRANGIRHQQTGLAERVREDYGIELTQLQQPGEHEARPRDEVREEIEELRRKINHLGNVNLEALSELEDLEGRYETLKGQYDDLSTAKSSLEKIIERIDADSRKLFAATFESIREHFRTLFRDLFGGGQADILLQDDVDILESTIEIVARPPGKEPRNISLLSGGEKTLTCVALLLAIFRSRPSPFCVLDEVDAALDEANIDRFTQVLRDFLSITQFIIVTHSKKTMTCADTMYGITMQESGVSKRVSVRFEDVSETGEILSSAQSSSASETADGEEQAA